MTTAAPAALTVTAATPQTGGNMNQLLDTTSAFGAYATVTFDGTAFEAQQLFGAFDRWCQQVGLCDIARAPYPNENCPAHFILESQRRMDEWLAVLRDPLDELPEELESPFNSTNHQHHSRGLAIPRGRCCDEAPEWGLLERLMAD